MKVNRLSVFFSLLVAVIMTASAFAAGSTNATFKGKEIRANKIVVVNNSLFKQLPVKANLVARTESIKAAYQGRVTRVIPAQGLEEWEIAGDLEKALNELNAIDGISAFPNFVFHREDTERGTRLKTTGETGDPYLADQWALNNDGSFNATAVSGADISALAAWTVTTGGTYTIGNVTSDVIVAVFDDGIDIDHEDLSNNIWINPGEDLDGNGVISESEWNGVDDDANGFVDDFYGWSVIYDDNSYLNSGSYHGTHVAGIIGAQGNNAVGIAGVNHSIKMLSVMIWDEWGDTDAITLMYGYYYLSTLLESGVKILAVNQSWGGGRDLLDRDDQRFIDVMTNYARRHDQLGMIWVCSAGNDAINLDKLNYYAYPRLIQSPNIICVGSTDYADQRSFFSNFGHATVDLGAPGTAILSCLPDNDYAYMDGTSMATPHVTGVIALAKSVFPGDDAHALMARVLATADRSSNFDDLWNTEARLNAYHAVAPTAEASGLLPSVTTAYIQKNFTEDYGVATVGFVNATTNAVTVSDAVISGAQASCFSLIQPPTKSLSATIVAGGAFGIPVKFISDAGSTATYNATLTLTVSGNTVVIPLVGIEQGYGEMEIDPWLSELGVTHYGDTLTSAFTITNTGEADLDYHLFQVLVNNNPRSTVDIPTVNTFKPETSTITKPVANKGKLIRQQFDKIAPAVANLNRTKIDLNFDRLEKNGSETVLWADSLNDSTATLDNWALLSWGVDEGTDVNWHLVNVSDNETKDFVFLAGDLTNGYQNNTLAIAVSPLFNFTTTGGKMPAYLSFDYAALMESGYDYFYINYVVDRQRTGTLLISEYDLTADGNMYRAWADISDLIGQNNVEFWFIFSTDESYIGGFGALFDNVEITTTDAPYYADNYNGTLSPAGQATITNKIRTDLLEPGEFALANWIESNALENWIGLNIVHFNSVIGHLSVDPVLTELGDFYRNQTARSGFTGINDGIVNVDFETEWNIRRSYDDDDVTLFSSDDESLRSAQTKLQKITKSAVKKETDRLKPSERIKIVAEQYTSTKAPKSTIKLSEPTLISKIFSLETAVRNSVLLSETFDAGSEIPEGWSVEDYSYGLGDVWHIETFDTNNTLFFGDPEVWQYYANSSTITFTPEIDLTAVPDTEKVFLEFDYACYVEEGYDYFDLYIGFVPDDPTYDIKWRLVASTEYYDFVNDGSLYSFAINLSRATGEKIVFALGAFTDGSVGDGFILVDNVSVYTKVRNIFVDPLCGKIPVGASQSFNQHINMKSINPGSYAMVTKLWYSYYSEGYDWWDYDRAKQRTEFRVVNRPPVVIDDTLNVVAGDIVGVNHIFNAALDNDYDEDKDYLYLWDVTDPIYGSFKQTGLEYYGPIKSVPEYWSYVAPLNYDGYDVIHYSVYDGFESSVGKILIRVAAEPRFVAGTQQEYTFLEDTTLIINTLRLVPGVGGVDEELFVWGVAKSNLVKIDADRAKHRLTFSTKTVDAWGQDRVTLYVGHVNEPFDSLKVTIVVVPVNDPPTAKFLAAKTNNTVTFTDQSDDSRDSEGAIVKWLWNFGDDQTSSEQNPTHVYAAINTYTVTLTVTDNGNASTQTSQDVVISNLLAIASEAVLPSNFELAQNFPNPFNPITTIRYALPERSTVRLTIYDMLGKEVRTLVNQAEDAGYKSVQWNGLDQRGQMISTGIYIYKIQAGNFTQTKKMIFMK
ncbi:MAG: S8 family serine peptidase [Candidatus Neomarinimicrobiota bacterium]